jgi:Rap1a immunity proteins
MRRAILVAVALSVLIGAGAWDAMLGNDLHENCKAGPRSKGHDTMSAFKTGACVGYVMGVASSLEGSAFCFPAGVEKGQIVDVIKRWLEDHPELRHYAASSLITSALKERFPCN